MAADLTRVGTGRLRALRDALAAGRLPVPLRPEDVGDASALLGLEPAAALAVLDAVLAERAADTRPAQLVWTGPHPVHSAARDTSVVLRELFERAATRVIVAGYAFDHGREIFAPLHRAMVERGVAVRLYLNIAVGDDERDAAPDAIIDARVAGFLRDNWPFGAPPPAIFYDPRPVTTERFTSLHAKCVVVDEAAALVTSANFTSRGQHRNVEVGALIRDPVFVRALAAQWDNATSHHLFVRHDR